MLDTEHIDMLGDIFYGDLDIWVGEDGDWEINNLPEILQEIAEKVIELYLNDARVRMSYGR